MSAPRGHRHRCTQHRGRFNCRNPAPDCRPWQPSVCAPCLAKIERRLDEEKGL